jgi:SWI/SNF-related matrix-associated actin-dependent regulator 1 of chromatin subfamily A
MITLDDIRENSVLDLLESYNGINPYLLSLKNQYLTNKKITLTDLQIKYINDNFEKEPIKINRVISITSYLGEELKKQNSLKIVPEKILFEFILAETNKAYHIYGKLVKNQLKSKLYWIPKNQVIDDPYFENIDIDVDFSKYNDVLSKYGKKLYKHQEEGVKFLLTRNRCILGDQMGVAKTMQSIVAALESGCQKILIICPASLKINWKREIEVFCQDVTIAKTNNWNTSKFTILNYDILKNFHTLPGKNKKETDIVSRELVDAKFDLIILDESHFIKSPDSTRSKIINDLCLNFYPNVKTWLVTGTPISNKVMDYFNLLKLVNSPIAKDWIYYARRYCDGKKFTKKLKNGKTKQIWVTNGASNLEELSNKTKNVIIRRLKSDVLELPSKTVTPVYQQLSNQSRIKYDKLWDDYIEKRKELKKSTNIDRNITELILLRKFIAMETIPYTIELTDNALEEDEKVIIFTCFTEELLELQKHYGNKCVTHHGSMSQSEKQISIDEFQNNNKIKVFIGNIASAGVGITLTSASVTIFNSFQWSPSDNEQAEDRNHRLGQKNKVSIYYQLFEDTISTRVWENVQIKKLNISTILDE